MKHRVLVDTCILVSASTYAALEESEVILKHHFFDECVGLITLFKNNISKRVGVITSTIENEAYKVLYSAVEFELTKTITDRKKFFEALSYCFNACQARMVELSTVLLREPISEIERDRHFNKVCDMYANIETKAREAYPPDYITKIKTKGLPHKIRGVASDIFYEQEWAKSAQLIRLFEKPVEDSDKKILAEAMYLQTIYRETERVNVELLLASTDQHFSPMRGSGIESRPITDEIKSICGISCDWPGTITEKMDSYIKSIS